MNENLLPAGWDEDRVKRVLGHYEGQSEEEAIAEDDAAYESTTHAFVQVPIELLPLVQNLLGARSHP